MTGRIRCPQCDRMSEPRAQNPHFPFCSERCKAVDLGRWLNQEYVISSPALDPDGFPMMPAHEDGDGDGFD